MKTAGHSTVASRKSAMSSPAAANSRLQSTGCETGAWRSAKLESARPKGDEAASPVELEADVLGELRGRVASEVTVPNGRQVKSGPGLSR